MPFLVDADSHIFPKEAMDVARQFGFNLFTDSTGKEWCTTPSGAVRSWGSPYYDLSMRISALKDAGFEKQVLICDQGFAPDYVPLETSKEIFRAFNLAAGKIQDEHGEFVSIADVPHQDVNEAIRETEYAIKEIGLRGIRIYGTWSGKNFESDEWEPFFDLVDRLRVPLFFHTHGTAGLGKFNPILWAMID